MSRTDYYQKIQAKLIADYQKSLNSIPALCRKYKIGWRAFYIILKEAGIAKRINPMVQRNIIKNKRRIPLIIKAWKKHIPTHTLRSKYHINFRIIQFALQGQTRSFKCRWCGKKFIVKYGIDHNVKYCNKSCYRLFMTSPEVRRLHRNRYRKDPQVRKVQAISSRKWKLKNRVRYKATNALYIQKIKDECKAYLGNKCLIEGCDALPEELQFHHLNGDGAKHREKCSNQILVLLDWRKRGRPTKKGQKYALGLACQLHHVILDVLIGTRPGRRKDRKKANGNSQSKTRK